MNKKTGKKTRKKDSLVLRIAVALLCPAAFFCFPVFAMNPFAVRASIGSIVVIGISALLFFRLVLTKAFDSFKQNHIYRKTEAFLAAILAAGFLYASFTAFLMLGAVAKMPSADADGRGVCLIVLGCQVRGTVPSTSLDRRIQAAQAFMESNPASVVIASGGQGDGEDITEAAAIRKQLIENGIDERRIYTEDMSTNTNENIAYSAQIIEREGLGKNVVIVTDAYHQYRAHAYAKKNGLSPSSLAAKTPWYLAGGYWAREILGNGYYLLFGFE